LLKPIVNDEDSKLIFLLQGFKNKEVEGQC